MSEFAKRKVKINGIPLEEYAVSVPDAERYALTLEFVLRCLRRYAGCELKIAESVAAHTIFLGPSRRQYAPFETEICYESGSLYLGAANETGAAAVFCRFFADYLDGTGDAEVNLPEGEAMYLASEPDWEKTPAVFSLQDRIVRSAMKVQHYLEYDHAAGKYFTYEHLGWKSNFDEARAEDNRVTNCVIVMNWVLKDVGLFKNGIMNHLYNGTVGYTCKQPDCREAMTGGQFEIIETDKTISRLAEDGNLYPGDIIFFLDYNADHNQIVLSDTAAIDGGRGNCNPHACSAPFVRFVGPNRCLNARAGLIFRAKGAIR